jgi:DNA invertase Pin-like site-specific DNA recombinase
VSGQPQRVVLYRRVSALMGRTGDDFHSPDIQLTVLRQATAGMVEVAVIDDFDQTGVTLDRDGIRRIREIVERDGTDLVAFMNASRLGRNVLESLLFVKWLEDRNVAVLSAEQQMDTRTRMGRMMLVNMLNVAEDRAREIGESWSRTIGHRTRAGFPHGPTPPYGYVRVPKVDGAPARVEVDPVAGPVVGQAFGMYADGTPVADIIRYITAARGRPVNRSTTKRMLRNPFYVGRVRLDGEVFDGRHPALVDGDVWGRVQARLRRDATTPARRLAPVHALTGLCLCEACQRPMVCRMDRGDRRLECQAQAQEYGCVGAGAPLVVLVEAAVLEQVTLYIDKLTADPQAVAARRARQARGRADVRVVEAKLAETRAGMLKITAGWRQGTIPDWVFEAEMRQLRAAEDTLAGQLAELAAPPATAPVKVQVSLAKRLLELWPDATPGERRRLIGLVVRRVWVRQAGVWREPVSARVRVEPW